MKTSMLVAALGMAMLAASPVHAQGQQSPQGQEIVGVPLDKQTVMQIQQKLNQQGFDAGDTDGDWGPETQAALKNFQQQKGMRATGQPDAQTLSALGVQSQAIGSSGGSGGQSGGSGGGSGGSGSGQQQPPRQ